MSAWGWASLGLSVVSIALSLYAYRLNRHASKPPEDGPR